MQKIMKNLNTVLYLILIDQRERLHALNATIGNLNSLQSNISKENHQELYKKMAKKCHFFSKELKRFDSYSCGFSETVIC